MSGKKSKDRLQCASTHDVPGNVYSFHLCEVHMPKSQCNLEEARFAEESKL